MVSIFFNFLPYLGKWSNLTNIVPQRHSPQGVIESPGVGYSKRLLGQSSTKFQWNNSIFALCAFDTLSVLSLPWVRWWPFCGPAFVRQQVHSLWVFSACSLGLITGLYGAKSLVDRHRPFQFSGRTCLATRCLWSSIRRSQQLHCFAWLDWCHYPLADWSLGHRAWWMAARVSWLWGFSTPQPVSFEHKPSMTFCSHFSWLVLGANRVTCFWFLTLARPKVIVITDDDVLVRLCEIVSCAWKVAEGKLRQPPLRSVAVSQVFFMWVADQLPIPLDHVFTAGGLKPPTRDDELSQKRQIPLTFTCHTKNVAIFELVGRQKLAKSLWISGQPFWNPTRLWKKQAVIYLPRIWRIKLDANLR